jgi:hypothetical protein
LWSLKASAASQKPALTAQFTELEFTEKSEEGTLSFPSNP